MITGILRNGPADQAGILPGDILLEINGRTVINGNSMLNLIASLKPGSPATLKVFRKKSVLTLHGKVGRRPTPQDS
jgi:serine protease DegQ